MFRFFHRHLAIPATLLVAGLAVGCDESRSSAARAEERPDPAAVIRKLDKQGGVRAVLELEAEGDTGEFIRTLEKRLIQVAFEDFLIEPQDRRITVTVADTADTGKLTALLRPTVLRLREVHPQSADLAETVFNGEEIVPGYRAFVHDGTNRDGEAYTEHLLLANHAAIGGDDIEDAWPQTQGSDHQVGIKLTPTGGDKMISLTRDMQPGRSRIAILLDDEVISAPTVQSVPLGRNFVIMGQDTFADAATLTRQLLTPLEIPFKLVSVDLVPAPVPSPSPAS